MRSEERQARRAEGRLRKLEAAVPLSAAAAAAASAGTWAPLVYSNSWADLGAGFQVGQYSVEGFRVWLRGQVARTGAPAALEVIATLNAAPLAQLDYAVVTDTGFGWVSVKTDGTIRWRSGGHGWLSFDGLSFDVR